jgi:3-oxoacyl-[acyl-carrier protein] reductase
MEPDMRYQSNHLKLLAGQVAWVTGSARGIGRAIAEELCRLSCKVAVHGLRSDDPKELGAGESVQQVADDIATAYNGETMAVWGDLALESEVKRIADDIRAKWKKIDILVCCAGGNVGAKGVTFGQGGRPSNDDCLNISLEDFQSVMDRNLMTAVLCCREVAPEMMERKSGRVITIGSTGGCVGYKSLCSYRVAKAALHMYTRCLAEQLRPYNIPVNCVALGSVVSERWHVAYGGGKSEDRLIKACPEERRNGTLERVAQPHELAGVVGFLCTPAGGYISGQVIRFDAGEQRFPG